MSLPNRKFLLSAMLLMAAGTLQAASFLPTSPLIQIGEDIDILFDSSVLIEVKDNLYSGVDKVSATSISIKPGFTLEYAKDSPLFASITVQRNIVSYYGKSSLSLLNNHQDSFSGNLNIDQGGPFKASLSSSYSESVRNDDLTSKGITGLGETLIRQGNYSQNLSTDYKLTEKVSASIAFSNTYNHYLNPTKIPDATTGDIAYNTNSLSELNGKSLSLNFTYLAPGDLITYGFSYSHTETDFSAAPYYKKVGSIESFSRPALPADPNFFDVFKNVKSFYGLTASGSPTSAGKLNLDTKVGFCSSVTSGHNSGDSKISGPSFNLNLNHTLSERISHKLSVSRDTSPTPSGADSRTTTYSYLINYSATQLMTLNFNASKSDVLTGGTKIGTMDYNLGLVYRYNSHLNITANLDALKTATPASAFQANSLSLQASFRY